MVRTGAGAGALQGVRVIELGHLIGGPFCGHLFADHGAEVIKVEPPAVGDPMRSWGGVYKGLGLYWPVLSRDKLSVTLDLRRPEGQDALLSLAGTADVLVENFRPGTLERWGLGPADLRAANPGLVVARVSGFGQTGPYRERPAYGLIAEALSGFRYLCGEEGRPSVRVGISLADSLAGTQAFVGALLSLYSRDRRDMPAAGGQVVDVALIDSMSMYMESVLPEFHKLGKVRGPQGPRLDGIAPSNAYPTRDAEWLVMGANQDSVFARLAKVMDRPEWLDEASPYASHVGRGRHQDDLDADISSWMSSLDADDAVRVLSDAGIPVAKVATAADLAADPHLRFREMVVEVPEPGLDGEPVLMPGVVPKLSDTPGRIRRGGPLLGEHNDVVWPSVLGADRYQELIDGGVV